jgi:hypothetical protein
MNSRYPMNWREIATDLKKKEKWQCYACGLQCLNPETMVLKGFSDSKKRMYLLQVHHWDLMPENNSPENLVCLCTSCHLGIHRRSGKTTPGQLILFDISPWYSLPGKAKLIKKRAVQLKLQVARMQLSFDLLDIEQFL